MSERLSKSTVQEHKFLPSHELVGQIQSPEFHYSAKSRMPIPDIDLLRGRLSRSFIMFEDTEYAIEIPYRGVHTTRNKEKEIEELSIDTLRTESFNLLYRHMYMLQQVGSPITVKKFIPTILERVSSETDQFVTTVNPLDVEQQKTNKKNIHLAAMACLETCEEDPNIKLSKDMVRLMHQGAVNTDPLYWRYALSFDERNKKEGDVIDIEGRFREVIKDNLLDPGKSESETTDMLLEATISNPDFQTNTLIYTLLKTASDEQIVPLIHRFAPVMGIERIRKCLRDYTSVSPAFKPKFDVVFNYLGLDPDSALVNLVSDIYEKINFENYEPNKGTQEFEVNLVKRELAGKHQICDVACGTGRHLESLDGQNGMNVIGVDIVKKHIEYIKHKKPELKALVASWFHLPFSDKSFDGAYIIGRSFTHNTTIPDAVMCLQEIGRILKDDGMVIIDLPDPEVGEYKELIDKTLKISRNKGLTNILPGVIIDGPDQEHYFDRFAPDQQTFTAIARLAGLHAEKIDEISYAGVTGQENHNIYWRLTKEKFPDSTYDHDSGRIFSERANITERRLS